MITRQSVVLTSLLLASAVSFDSRVAVAGQPERLRLLIVDGQNNHDWQATTPVLKGFLEQSGRFTVDVATSPPAKAPASDWDSFRRTVCDSSTDRTRSPLRRATDLDAPPAAAR